MTVAVLAMTTLAVLVIVIFRLAIRRVMQERERMRQAELIHQQRLLYNSISTQERERQRIAANLHDELSSRLTILKLNLHQVREHHSGIPEQMLPLLDETLRLSRDISHDLYPPLLAELGLAETLKDYLQPLQKKLLLELRIDQKGEYPGSEVALQLFRIAQELIQNVLKHAHATKLSLQLRITGKYTALLVQDNGLGFEPGGSKNGLGLGNIESRTQMCGGSLRVRSKLKKGTSTLILIPHAKD